MSDKAERKESGSVMTLEQVRNWVRKFPYDGIVTFKHKGVDVCAYKREDTVYFRQGASQITVACKRDSLVAHPSVPELVEIGLNGVKRTSTMIGDVEEKVVMNLISSFDADPDCKRQVADVLDLEISQARSERAEELRKIAGLRDLGRSGGGH